MSGQAQRRWRLILTFGLCGLSAEASAMGQVPAPPPAQAPPTATPPSLPTAQVTLSPPQRAALMLGRWETCVDVSVKFLAQQDRRPERIARNAERRCEEFTTRLRPIVAETLRDMMYGSSDRQVAEQTEAALTALRRHIHGRALAAAEKARATN